LTDAIRKALAERLGRERLRRGVPRRLADRLEQFGRECAALPDYDTRSPDEIDTFFLCTRWIQYSSCHRPRIFQPTPKRFTKR
jgi:Rv0623-like transcription factor